MVKEAKALLSKTGSQRSDCRYCDSSIHLVVLSADWHVVDWSASSHCLFRLLRTCWMIAILLACDRD